MLEHSVGSRLFLTICKLFMLNVGAEICCVHIVLHLNVGAEICCVHIVVHLNVGAEICLFILLFI